MSDLSDDEAWTLTTERIAQVLADVRKTPCPRSAHCPDDVSRVQFSLHIIAEKALAELLDHRAAQAASADRVRSVVREALVEGACKFGLHRDLSAELDAIADRVASQLGPVGLSAEERATAEWLKSLAAAGVFDDATGPVGREHSANCRRSIALLDRLLGGRDVG